LILHFVGKSFRHFRLYLEWWTYCGRIFLTVITNLHDETCSHGKVSTPYKPWSEIVGMKAANTR